MNDIQKQCADWGVQLIRPKLPFPGGGAVTETQNRITAICLKTAVLDGNSPGLSLGP